MSFKDLKSVPEFTKLHSQRAGILACIIALKDGVDQLPTDKLSWRLFSKLETNIETESANLSAITKKIGVLLKAKGGDLGDPDFVQYIKDASISLSTLEKAQNNYFELLSEADMVPKEKPDMSNDLVGILQSLTATQKAAVEAQASSNKSHKKKEMEQPRFDPTHVRHDPLAFKTFFRKFEIFTKDVEEDKDRLQWLQTSMRGDASHLISKLSLNDANYDIAVNLLKSHYLNEDRILDKLLSKITKFSFPCPNKDFSNFTSTFVSLNVYLEEIKSEHHLDFTEGTAERLLRHIVHHAMPASILDEYRNILSKSFPTFKEFFDNMHKVVNKLQDKNECTEKSKSLPKQNSVSSTIPENAINIVKSL